MYKHKEILREKIFSIKYSFSVFYSADQFNIKLTITIKTTRNAAKNN